MGRHASAGLALLALVLMAAPGGGQSTDQETIRTTAAAAAREAYDRKDLDGFLLHSRALVALVPRSTRALYNLACAQSLTGDAAGTARTLERLADWGVAFDLDADSDFDPVRDSEAFRAVAERMKGLREPVGDSPVAFTLPQKDLLAEGVAHDPKTGDFLVSGVHRRKVVRVDARGRVRDFVAEGSGGLAGATGIVVDGPRRTLWVSTEASPLMSGFREEERGQSFLLEYDLDSAALRRRVEPPGPDGRVSDLALGPDGTLYAADPLAGRVYRLAPGAKRLEVLVEKGTIGSPQGMAAHPDGATLFVADYTQGIARVALETGKVAFLESPEDLLTTGIDGLVLAGDSLVGIQNGLSPHRVLRLRFDASRTRILAGQVLERGHPRFDEPTLGVLVGSDLYYVANSQYRHFGADGTPDLEHLVDPVVLRLALPWLPQP